MSNEVVPPQNKRRKKMNEEASPSSWCGLTSLPDSVAMTCVAGFSTLDRATLCMVTKSHRSLVISPELSRTRWLMGCTEESLFVCLRVFPDLSPRWFILGRKRRQLIPIRSHPNQAQESSSFVVVNWGIYVIGGLVNGNPTSDVLLLDCCSKKWSRVPSMKMARASASASFVDGKIYVFGGCEDSSKWGEVFDTKTKTWDTLPMAIPEMNIHQSVVVTEEKKIYVVDEENQSFCYLPSEDKWTRGKRDDCEWIRNRKDWCVIGNELFSGGARGRILWCEPDELDWKEVKGLEGLRKSLSGTRQHFVRPAFNRLFWIRKDALRLRESRPFRVTYGISSLSSNSAGNIVILWKTHLEDPHSFELWSAEISLEKRNGEGGVEVWGKVEWFDSVFKFDPHSLPSSDKVALILPWKRKVIESDVTTTTFLLEDYNSKLPDDIRDSSKDIRDSSLNLELKGKSNFTGVVLLVQVVCSKPKQGSRHYRHSGGTKASKELAEDPTSYFELQQSWTSLVAREDPKTRNCEQHTHLDLNVRGSVREVRALAFKIPSTGVSDHANSFTNPEQATSLAVEAATIASQWLDFLHQDLSGRLAAVQDSRNRVHSILTTELPHLVSSTESSSNRESTLHLTNTNTSGDVSSDKTVTETHQIKWSAKFYQIKKALCDEEKDLERSLNQVKEMQSRCNDGLRQMDEYSPFSSQSSDSSFGKDGSNLETSLAVQAAAASIFSTCSFLLSMMKPPATSS